MRNQSEKLFALLVQNVESRKAVSKEILLVTIRMYSYAKVFSCPHADMTMTALVRMHGRLLAVALVVAVLADCVFSCRRADVHRYRRGELGPAQPADQYPQSGTVVHMSVLI